MPFSGVKIISCNRRHYRHSIESALLPLLFFPSPSPFFLSHSPRPFDPSDIFATLAAINLSVRELKFAGSDNCFFPAAKWNNLSELIDSFELSGYDDITGTAASPINYTLVFSDQRGRECWTTQLNATTNSYNVTHKQSNCGKTFFLHLQIEALLQNGSHLHIISPLVHSSATNCTGKLHCTSTYVFLYVPN